MGSLSDCPVVIEAREVAQNAKTLNRSMRKLRRSLRLCDECPEHENCFYIQRETEIINQVLQEIAIEWGLND